MPATRLLLLGLAAATLGACASPYEDAPGQLIDYPKPEIGFADTNASVRWADPGDVVWMQAWQVYRRDLDGAVLRARDPADGQWKSWSIQHWRTAQKAGDYWFYAPQWYFYGAAYVADDSSGRRVLKPVAEIPAAAPPYVCVKGDNIWQANLTWTLGRCQAGHPTGRLSQILVADIRDWREESIRVVEVKDGTVTFVARHRAGWTGPGRTSTPTAPSPQAKEMRFSTGVGRVEVPDGMTREVAIIVTAIEGQRVFYKLARPLIQSDPNEVQQ